MNKLIVLSATLSFLYGCQNTKNVAAANAAAMQQLIADDTGKKLTKDKELYAATNETMPLDTAYINKDTLHVITTKVNACDADNFKLMWNGMMTKSMPPQTSVKLFLLSDPTCKETHPFHLTFSLKPMHNKQDQITNNTIMLRVSGWKEMLKYVY